MNVKRHKRRLRKQVLIIIPILLFIIVLSGFLFINRKTSYSNEVSPYEVAANYSDETPGVLLSEIEPIVNLGKTIELRQKDNTVIYYANAFKLNLNVILDVVHNLTNNYTSEAFLNTNIIGSDAIIAANGSFASFEAGVAYFARDIYRYPEKYGKTIEEVRTDETSTIKAIAEDGKIYMDNGLTFEQYVGKISNLFGMNPSLVLAITYEETGIMTSNLFRNSNNIGGHRGYDGWMNFTTLEAGVIAHVLSIRSIYSRFGIDVNDPNATALFSGVYVNGVYGDTAYSWLGKVEYFQTKINEKDLFTIEK